MESKRIAKIAVAEQKAERIASHRAAVTHRQKTKFRTEHSTPQAQYDNATFPQTMSPTNNAPKRNLQKF